MIIVIDDKIGALSYIAYNLKEGTSTTCHYSIKEAINGAFKYSYPKSEIVKDLINYFDCSGEIVHPPDLTLEKLLATYKLTYPEHFI